MYIEFLLAFVPFFLLFLFGVQLALVASARIVVTHAAVQAVRAAIVTIDDDPYYDDGRATRKALSRSARGKGPKTGQALLSAVAGGKMPKSAHAKSSGAGCDRLQRIRAAAYLPLSVVSPSKVQLLRMLGPLGDAWLGASSVHDGVGDSSLSRIVLGYSAYNRLAAAVTFPSAPGSDELRSLEAGQDVFADDEVITARVTYLFSCAIPIVASLMCRSLADLTREDQTKVELGQVETVAVQRSLLAHAEARFLVLRAEASLPNQGAPYEYASERCLTEAKLDDCHEENNARR